MTGISRHGVRLGLLVMVAVLGLVHPGDLIAGGALFGAGAIVSSCLRRRHEEREQTLDVATWIDERTFPSDTVPEIVRREAKSFRLRLLDLRRSRRLI